MKKITKVRIPSVEFNSEYFECKKCGYKEPRLVKGDISTTPCPRCGNSPLYRVN